MQRLEVSCAVRRIYMSLGAKGLNYGLFILKPCGIVRLFRRFVVTCCAHLQGDRIQSHRRFRPQVTKKRRRKRTIPCGLRTKKTVIHF